MPPLFGIITLNTTGERGSSYYTLTHTHAHTHTHTHTERERLTPTGKKIPVCVFINGGLCVPTCTGRKNTRTPERLGHVTYALF